MMLEVLAFVKNLAIEKSFEPIQTSFFGTLCYFKFVISMLQAFHDPLTLKRVFTTSAKSRSSRRYLWLTSRLHIRMHIKGITVG